MARGGLVPHVAESTTQNKKGNSMTYLLRLTQLRTPSSVGLPFRLLLLLLTLVAFGSMANSANAAIPGTIQPLEALQLDQVPLVSTAVVTEPVDSAGFATAVRRALETYQAVYVVGASPVDLTAVVPESLVRGTSVSSRASAIYRTSDGVVCGLAVVVSDETLPASEYLDQLTKSVNSNLAPSDTSAVGSILGTRQLSVAGSHYSSVIPWYAWAGDIHYSYWGGVDHVGWQRVTYRGHNLRDDGSSTYDYWVAECLQETDPGHNSDNNLWYSKEVRTKYWESGQVLSIGNCMPNTTTSGSTISYNIGWPPSLSMSYNMQDVDIYNESSPQNGYARWRHTFEINGATAGTYYVSDPSYEATVTQNASLSVFTYVTNVFRHTLWNMDNTTNWPPWSCSLAKPPY